MNKKLKLVFIWFGGLTVLISHIYLLLSGGGMDRAMTVSHSVVNLVAYGLVIIGYNVK